MAGKLSTRTTIHIQNVACSVGDVRMKLFSMLRLFALLQIVLLTGLVYGQTPGTQKWAFATTGSVYYSSPSIGSDGTIYVGSRDNKLYAIKPDGTQKWAFTTLGDINF